VDATVLNACPRCGNDCAITENGTTRCSGCGWHPPGGLWPQTDASGFAPTDLHPNTIASKQLYKVKPTVTPLIDPRTVLIGIPCHDGKLMTELSGMLVQNRDLFGAYTMPTECSHPAIARNTIVDTFERSPFEWLIGIDSDIVPQRPDFELMLQAIDECPAGGPYLDPDALTDDPASGRVRQPTRVEVPLRGGGVGFADALVCAEYSYRREPFEPVKLGCGFYRVHRSVFSVLQQLQHEDDGRVEVDTKALCELLDNPDDACADPGLIKRVRDSMSTKAGTPRLWQCTFQGRTFYDYYPSGPLINLLVPIGDWKGEDHGFWTLCMLAGLIPRIETRTQLLHIGRKAYPYIRPDDRIIEDDRHFGQPHFGHGSAP
jgi:hypothetical protein